MKKDNLIFIHKLLKAIADSIIKIFIPLYILKITGSLWLSIIYLVSYSLLVFLLLFIFKKVIQKYGIACIFIHFVFIIASNAILTLAPLTLFIVLLVSFLMAISQTCYSVPLNVLFALDDKNTNVAKFQIPSNIGKLLFTLVSGILLGSKIKDSFLILCIASSIFYIFSLIPLIFCYRDLLDAYKVKQDNSSLPKEKIDPLFSIFHIVFGVFQPIIDNIIPLFLFINNLSFTAVAILIALVELVKIAINLLAKFLCQKKLQILSLILGASFSITSLIGLLLCKNAVILYVLSLLYSISFPLVFVPMFKLYCQHLKVTDNVLEGISKRDIEIFSLRPILYTLYFIGFGLYPVIGAGFVVIPLMTVLGIKLTKKYK